MGTVAPILRPYRFVFLGFVALWLAGCATVDPGVCGRFDQARQSLRYDTVYRYSDADTRHAAEHFKPRPGKAPVTVRWYTLRANASEVPPCEHLYLTKDLYLQRQAGDDLIIEETREFYTGSGKRVAIRKENLTRQLTKSGYYHAIVPLPIPETAPAGAYKVVSRLTLRTNGGKETVLASTSAEFRVAR